MLEVSSNQQEGETRREVHANASLTPQGRLTMVGRLEQDSWTLARAAAAAGVSVKTREVEIQIPHRRRVRPHRQKFQAETDSPPDSRRPGRGDRRASPDQIDRG